MIRSISAAAVLATAALSLGGCASSMAPFGQTLAMAQGPAPEITGKVSTQSKMTCVASYLKPGQRVVPFGVIAAPDRTGKANFAGNDATGSFNTQGAADMITSSLGRAGVRIVELGPEYRAILDWGLIKADQGLIGDGRKFKLAKNVSAPSTTEQTSEKTEKVVKDTQGKDQTIQTTTTTTRVNPGESSQVVTDVNNIPLSKGTLYPVRYGVYGAITSLDFVPGGGVSAGAYGASVGYNQNRAQIRIDLRLVEMPIGTSVGGRVVATTTVKKQVVNDGMQISLTRYFGSATPVLANFDAGAQRREALQDSTCDLVELGVADLLEQVFMKKRSPCTDLTIAAQ